MTNEEAFALAYAKKKARLASAPPAAVPDAVEDESRKDALIMARICQQVRHSSTSVVDRDNALRDAATLLRKMADDALTPPPVATAPVVDAEQLAERVYRAGHSEGWRGNQLRRDTQMVDADTGWRLYVTNGALAKSIEAATPTPPAGER